MSHADWKRYYIVIARDTVSGEQHAYCGVWKRRHDAVQLVLSMRVKRMQRPTYPMVPIGIVSVRGRKRNPQLQQWLVEHSR